MKILYVTTVPGTINAFLIPHIKLLVEKGYTVDIATSNVDLLKEDIHELGCRVFEIPFSRSPIRNDNLKSYFLFKKILKTNKYDIIHTHTPIASFIVRLAAANKRKNDLKIVYTAHGFHFYKGAPLKYWILFYPMEKLMSYFTDVLITINEEDYMLSVSRLSAKRILKFPGVGIDLKRFCPIKENKKNEMKESLKLNEFDFVLTYVAELNDNKNQIVLIESIKILVENDVNIALLLVGSGKNYKKYGEMIRDLNLNNNVFLLGKRSDIPNILAATDIYLASSIREGLPINIIEAMSIGLPVVASNNRGHKELVITNENGFLIDEINSKIFAEKIFYLISNPCVMKQFGKKSEEIAKKYDVNKIAKLVSNIYK